MSALPLPIPPASAFEAGAAFATALACALRRLHEAGGGDRSRSEAVARAAELVAGAILDGETSVDLAAQADGAAVLEALRGSPIVATASGPPPARDATRAPTTPLVLADGRLYLARYFEYERELLARLAAMNRPAALMDPVALRAQLDRYFPAPEGSSKVARPNWQKIAAATAALRQLCVISGGPGTGKTTTVVKILAILLTLDPKLRIAIAAPTGKAAARVQESIRAQLASLELPDTIAQALPREPHTLHRLLGSRPGATGFRHDSRNRLPYDVVVVDEASMLDLALAAKLVAALRDDARLILLGDKDQLASVEAGAVYAGLSATRSLAPDWARAMAKLTGEPLPALDAAAQPLRDAVVWLEHSYRFGADSALGRLARAINAGDADGTTALLGAAGAAGDAAVSWSRELPAPRALAVQLAAGFEPYVTAVQSGRPAAEVFAAFDAYRVLCSTREGAYGSVRLGALLVDHLRRRLGGGTSAWFMGRPVLITANDYTLRLFNGDVGIVLPDAGGAPLVHFQGADGTLRTVAPSRLGDVQDAMAITVHRAQGSEFERVALVVEPAVTRGLSRQLLYTGVTRARQAAAVYALTETLRQALQATSR